MKLNHWAGIWQNCINSKFCHKILVSSELEIHMTSRRFSWMPSGISILPTHLHKDGHVWPWKISVDFRLFRVRNNIYNTALAPNTGFTLVLTQTAFKQYTVWLVIWKLQKETTFIVYLINQLWEKQKRKKNIFLASMPFN